MSAEIIFLHGACYKRCNAVVNKHYKGYYTIQLISAGEVELFYGNTRHVIKPFSYWPGYPGPHTRFHAAPGHRYWTHRYIAFCGPLPTRWMADGLFPCAPQSAPPNWDCENEFDRLLSLFQSSSRWDIDRARNALERLLIELAACRTSPHDPRPWLKTVLARISAVEKQPLNYLEMASDAGLSLSSMRRQFKLATGCSLHGYALQCRMGVARRLLAEGSLPIKNIAERLGYCDAYFFSRQFRQFSGMPPAAFRKSYHI